MRRNWFVLLLIFVVLFSGLASSASATPPAKIVSGVVSNIVSALIKWLWSLKSTPKTEEEVDSCHPGKQLLPLRTQSYNILGFSKTTIDGVLGFDFSAVSTRAMMKFEGGYTVETVFDGSKLGIDPYSVEVSPTGEFLVLDSENSNVYKISTPLSRYSRPKLIAGSHQGYSGHVDGKLREARMNHPRGITVDDRGNIYIADTLNMAIRKISDAGVVTIAGGKWGRGGGHVDGPSEDAKFSDDFDVIYIGSSCSLLVVDRGNQAIREIQLQEDDCAYNHDGNLHLGIAVLVAAGFFGYMLALLQRRVRAMFSSHSVLEPSMRKGMPQAPYQKPIRSVRAPLIPPEGEYEQPEEGLFSSLGRLFLNTGSTILEIFASLFSGFRRKPLQQPHFQEHYYQQPSQHSQAWPMQESFVIPEEDEPPSIETRNPITRKNYPLTTNDMEKNHHHQQYFKQTRAFQGGWNGSLQQQQQQQYQQHHQRHYSSGPQTYYEQSCETNEIVFGAVQEQDGRREAVVIKAVDHGDPKYNNHNIRSRYNYMGGYSYGY